MNIKLKRGVVFSEADDQSVLTGSGRAASYYRLNEVGTRFVRLVLQGASVERAVEVIARFYGVAVEQVSLDIDELINELRAAGLIKVSK